MPPDTTRTESVPTADGLNLAYRRWPATDRAARGTILLVHGLGEHCGRYEHVAARFAGRGWDVVGHDLRGHGRSGGKRGSIPRGTAFLDDLSLVYDNVVREGALSTGAPTRSRPVILLGHSLGGLLAAQFVARTIRPVDALVLSSPALRAELSLLQRVQLAIGSLLTPDLAVSNQLKVDKISHDPAVVRAYRQDPLVHDRITARLTITILDGGREVLDAAATWRVPTLLLWAGDDHLVSARGSDRFAEVAPPELTRARRFDALYHEILNEPESGEVLATIDGWLDERFPPILLR
jgi:alpha-beta hydrolase superfamily lysophospholipase